MKEHFGQSMREESSRGIYKNEVEMPEMAAAATPGPGEAEMPMGCMDFKGQAAPIVYGQSGEAGAKADERMIHSQFKNYGWQ